MNPLPTILVVDDHHEIRDPLAAYLRRHAFRVLTAADAPAARSLLRHEPVDLIVLDIMMPGEDGLSLCRHLAGTGTLPVILLTAMASHENLLDGLESGADDYMTKPFDPRELLARIKAVLRRSGRTPGARRVRRYAFGQWILDIEKHELRASGGEPVALGGAEFRLLRALLERPGTVLSRDQLMELTRGREAPSFDRSVDSQVSRLRKKLESDPRRPSLLKTSWGGGYVLTADVRALA